jgi:hypothetical protein
MSRATDRHAAGSTLYAGTHMFPLAFNGLTSLIQKWLVAGVRIQIDLESSNDFFEIIQVRPHFTSYPITSSWPS